MHNALPAAISNSEFFALYQPQISVADGRIVAAEALLRWQRPGVGIVQPSEFVRFAEENGLIDPIGTYILQMACREAAAWPDLRVAVNVSQKQFARPNLADFICEIARVAGLPLNRLEIEVTETAAFPDINHAIAELKTLRARGVLVSLDDLGSGGATMELMAQLPLDRVKIGRELVGKYAEAEGAARLRTLIAAAQKSGLGVTAEGIETQAERDFLSDLGSDQMQGFLFAQPMSAQELQALMGAR